MSKIVGILPSLFDTVYQLTELRKIIRSANSTPVHPRFPRCLCRLPVNLSTPKSS